MREEPQHHLPAGSIATGRFRTVVTPETAGWGYSGLRVVEMPAGGTATIDTGPEEMLVLLTPGRTGRPFRAPARRVHRNPVRPGGDLLRRGHRRPPRAGNRLPARLRHARTADRRSRGGPQRRRRAADIERFLDGTDPDHVSLCLDTGHVAYGGGDAVELIRRYAERVDYVHLKQLDPAVLAQVHDEDLSFGEAVKRGVCVEPPAGEPAPNAVIDALREVDARVFVIVEQDLYPCAPDVPQPIAVRTRRYLNSCGLGARHQRA